MGFIKDFIQRTKLGVFLGVFALGLGGFSSLGHSSVTFFTDEASFLSQLGSSTTIDFEGIVADNAISCCAPTQVIDGVTFGGGGSYGVTGKDHLGIAGTPFDSALLFSNLSDPITVDLTTAGSGFTAIGGFFGDINSAGTPGQLELFGTGGLLSTEAIITADMGLGTPSNFFGFIVSGDEILSLTYTLFGNWEGIDNLVIGTADPSPIPVPAALPLLAGGLGLFGLMGWRRKRKATAA